MTKAKELYDKDLDGDEKTDFRHALLARRGVRGGFRLVLWILASAALVGAVASSLLAFSILPLASIAIDFIAVGVLLVGPPLLMFVAVWRFLLGLPQELRFLPREPFSLRPRLSQFIRRRPKP